MKASASHKRWIRWAICLLALSPAIALLGINAALLIPKVRGKAISIVGRRVGISGTADSLRYTPWGGVQMANFKVGDGSLIRAGLFSFDLEETKLFSRVLSVKDVSLEGGAFTFLYRAPQAVPVIVASVPQQPPIPHPQPPPVVAQEKPSPKKIAPPVKVEARKRWSTSIGSVRIEDVRFVVKNQTDGTDLILAENYDFISPHEGEGEVSLGALSLVGHKVASDIKGVLGRDEKEVFTVTSLSGNVLGAPLTGSLQFAPRLPGIPFAVDLGIKGLAHSEIIGTADAAIKMQGGGFAPQSWRGQVQILAPGALSLAKFPSAEFIQSQLQGAIQGGAFQIVDARAIASSSGMLSLRASGHATVSGDLAFNIRPYILSEALPATQKLLAPIFGGNPPAFALLSPSPLAFTDFALRGKATAPQLFFSTEHPPLPLLDLFKNLKNPRPEN